MAAAGEIKSVKRALALLTAFDAEEPEISVTDLARRVGVHKSTVSRLMATLEAQGFVQRNPRSNRFSLGLRLLELAGLVTLRLDLRQLARPVLEELRDACQETVNIAIYDQGAAVNIDQVASRQAIQYLGWVGRRTPAHCSATGKALLAHQPEAEIERVLGGPLPRLTERTIVDAAALRVELERVRRQGYAVSDGEFQEGVYAVAGPVRAAAGGVVAVVSITAPSYRTGTVRQQEFVGLVRAAAERLSQQLGYVAPELALV